MSKKNKNKKKRDTYLYGTTNGEVSSLSFTYDSETDSFFFNEADKTTTRVVTSYVSESGKEKVTNSVPCYDGISSINPTKDLIGKYSTIFGIDTNSIIFKGTKLSVACVYKADINNDKIPLDFFSSICIINPREGINPETISWHIFLNILYGDFNQGLIALVTDSDRARHEQINNRQACYYDNYILPTYVRLIYGSSDKKNDGLPNALVYLCDAASKQVLNHFNEIDFNLPRTSNGDENFDGYFMIKSNGNKTGRTIDFKFN